MKTNQKSRTAQVVAFMAATLVAGAVGYYLIPTSSEPLVVKATGGSDSKGTSRVKIGSQVDGLNNSGGKLNEPTLGETLSASEEAALISEAIQHAGTPASESAIIRLQLGLSAEGVQRAIDRIDDPRSSNQEREQLIRVISGVRSPQAIGSLRALVQSDEFKNNEPLLHAAVTALVQSGTVEDINPVMARLDTLPFGSTESSALITLLMSHANQQALPYLRQVVVSDAESEVVRKTAIWMMANHSDQTSLAFLRNLSSANNSLSETAQLTLDEIQRRTVTSQVAPAIPITVQ